MITRSLKVMLWGNEIGRLSWDERRNISYFEYSPDFLRGDIDAFPLLASIKSPISMRPVFGDKEMKIYHKLPPFLADSLPDAWGSQVFECWRTEQGIKQHDISPLDKLAFIGKRGMGALEFVPETSGIKKSEKVNLQLLANLAQRIVTERENIHIKPDESITLQSLIAIGTSAGGRQPKAILAVNHETGEIRSGQVAEQKGFDYCILKFGNQARSSAELEMTYYELAKTAGIDMMPCKLVDVDGTKHFITMRFDRYEGKKIHMQTLAALCPEADSYEQLLMVCRKLRLPEQAQEEVYRRMIFNILANNTDDHNKNFSFLMKENGSWQLSPAYDLTYIFNTGGFLPETMHCLTMRGKVMGHTKDDALAFAKENGIRRAESIIKDVVDSIVQFASYAQKNNVRKCWISAVEVTLNDYLERWGYRKHKESVISFETDGHTFTCIRVEQTYKGNYHLYATMDGEERKFVIGNNREEFQFINETGIPNLTGEQLATMAKKFFLQGEDMN